MAMPHLGPARPSPSTAGALLFVEKTAILKRLRETSAGREFAVQDGKGGTPWPFWNGSS